jgi:hypothetical protein
MSFIDSRPARYSSATTASELANPADVDQSAQADECNVLDYTIMQRQSCQSSLMAILLVLMPRSGDEARGHPRRQLRGSGRQRRERSDGRGRAAVRRRASEAFLLGALVPVTIQTAAPTPPVPASGGNRAPTRSVSPHRRAPAPHRRPGGQPHSRPLTRRKGAGMRLRYRRVLADTDCRMLGVPADAPASCQVRHQERRSHPFGNWCCRWEP